MKIFAALTSLAFLVSDIGVSASKPHIVFRYTDAYELIWNDRGSGADLDGAIWRVVNYQSDFCSLGDVATATHAAPANKAILVQKQKGFRSLALAQPVGFDLVWKDHGSGAKEDVGIYNLIAPNGYSCLGSVAVASHSALPNPAQYCCVRNEYLVQAGFEKNWNDRGSGADKDVSLWTVIRAGGDAYGINAGSFIATIGYGQPRSPPALLLKEDGVKVRDLWSLPSTSTSDKPLDLHEVNSLDFVWNDAGSGADKDVSIWRATKRAGYHSLGDIVVATHRQPKLGYLVKPTDSNDLDSIRPPVSFSKIWNDRGSGAKRDVTLWRVVCPGGYVSLGGVATDGRYPNSGDVSCIKRSYAVYSTSKNWQVVWRDHGSGAAKDVSIFEAKATANNQQSVRGFGALESHRGLPEPPFMLTKASHTYWTEKPVEKIIVTSVKYDLNAERKQSTPTKMSPTVVENFSDLKQSVERTIGYSVESSYTFTFNQAIQVGVEVEMTGKLPLVGQATTTASLSSTTSFGYEDTISKTTDDSITATVTLPGNSKITAVIIGNEYKADIPFTATMKKIYFDGTHSVATTNGVYKGVAIKEIRVSYGKIEPLN